MGTNPVEIDVVNRQRAARVSIPAVRSLVAWLIEQAVRLDSRRPWHAVSVVITGDREIAALKGRHMGIREVTDVLSFRYAEMSAPPGAAGEIVVNAERALQEGRVRPGGSSDELALYLAHACNHLLGETDSTPAARRRMRGRERRWLRRARAAGRMGQLIRA